MNICKKCNNELNGNFCSNCGQPTRVTRINGQYLLHEVGSVLNFQKGILFTIKELLIKPGQNIREFIAEDRNRLVKPIMFLIVCSLIYTLATRFFHFHNGYFYYSGEEKSTETLVFGWIQNNYGYVNILMAIFISGWIKIFFKKYGYNLFEILILLCFVMGIGMLLFAFFGIVDSLTDLKVIDKGFVIGMLYIPWAIGQFFDQKKYINYLKAFVSYFLGMMTFLFSVILLVFIIDWI